MNYVLFRVCISSTKYNHLCEVTNKETTTLPAVYEPMAASCTQNILQNYIHKIYKHCRPLFHHGSSV